MARILDEDLQAVRDRARIDDVVGSYVTLRRRGADLTGLCPFHDEKTPSFHVTPSKGLYYCFGCGAGGDVFKFVSQVENASYGEAVQQLADRYGVTLRFEDGPSTGPAPGLRSRILAANLATAEFYAAQLLTPAGLPARQMLDGRGFDKDVAQRFGVGFAPRDGQSLHEHLAAKGFKDDELVKANLIRSGGWDVFQGRVVWPIRDQTSSVLGFGARRLFEDDRMPGKYVNTAETPVYKKSHVLYGLDLARGPIGKKGQAVVMEGYTDVMAAHLSGVDTAVASCGTAFGEDHARLLQRMIGAPEQGEVVFTFDGDEAGQNAALKVFALADRFAVPTYVAVAPDGLDPCDLRLQRGETAVRDLVARPVPLYDFVMRHALEGFDLDRADSRVDAVRAVAPLVAQVQDEEKRTAFFSEVAALVGMDEQRVRDIVRKARRRGARPAEATRRPARTPQPPENVEAGPVLGDAQTLPTGTPDTLPIVEPIPYPPAGEPSLAAERGVCQLLLQCPVFFTTDWCGLAVTDFRHPAYREIFAVVATTPFDPDGWAQRVMDGTADDNVRRLETELLMTPLLREPDAAYADAYAARVRLGPLVAHLDTLRARLQRMNPMTQADEQVPLFKRVIELEAQKLALTRVAAGI